VVHSFLLYTSLCSISKSEGVKGALRPSNANIFQREPTFLMHITNVHSLLWLFRIIYIYIIIILFVWGNWILIKIWREFLEVYSIFNHSFSAILQISPATHLVINAFPEVNILLSKRSLSYLTRKQSRFFHITHYAVINNLNILPMHLSTRFSWHLCLKSKMFAIPTPAFKSSSLK